MPESRWHERPELTHRMPHTHAASSPRFVVMTLRGKISPGKITQRLPERLSRRAYVSEHDGVFVR